MISDPVMGDDGVVRCGWAGTASDYNEYHDHEWGRPVVDDVRLFEKLCLEGFQSGLAWITILRKRENFRAAFDGFDFRVVANYDDDDVARLLDDAGIVRHQGKIRSTINNAKRAVTLVEAEGSLARYVWSWEPSEREGDVDGEFTVPATTPTSTAPRQGPEEAWLDLRRSDHRLCVHAGDGVGERSCPGVRMPCGVRGRTGCARTADTRGLMVESRSALRQL